jgi:hypothetical protein
VRVIKIYGTLNGECHIKGKYYKNKKGFQINGSPNFSLDDLQKFPLITDFELAFKYGKSKWLGNHLNYYSKQFGILSSFPWWDHVDRQVVNFESKDIPLGTIDSPFHSCGQDWQIMIFSKRDFVYILQCDGSDHTNFNVWYRVGLEDYHENWSRLIQFVKENFAEN